MFDIDIGMHCDGRLCGLLICEYLLFVQFKHDRLI